MSYLLGLFEESGEGGAAGAASGMIGPLTILEAIIGVLILLSVIKGIRKGLSGQILGLIGLVGGAIVASKLKEKAATVVQGLIPTLNEKLASLSEELVAKIWAAIGFASVWLIVIVVAWILSLLIKGKRDKKHGSLDKLLGAAVSVVIWVVLLSGVLALINLIPTDNETISNIFAPLNTQINGGLYLKYLATPDNFIGKWVISMFSTVVG